jgi:UDPglucose 6-dehydrogenase
LRRLQSYFGNLRGKKITVLGLTYTPNTDTLRRSFALELCRQLFDAGANVFAFDPAVKALSSELDFVSIAANISDALTEADAVAVCTEWPQFRESDWKTIVPQMRHPVIVDPNRFLNEELKTIAGVEHLSVGRA